MVLAAVADADTAKTSQEAHPTRDDRSAALLAAGLGLLGIGGAASLAGSSSASSPPPSAVIDPPTPDHPKSDPSLPDHPNPDHPNPDHPNPDQSKPDQPQQPDPGKSDPQPHTDPDPTPSAHVPAAPTLSLASDTGRSDHDAVTASGAVNVAGLEAGATLAISLDGGKTWTSRGGDALLPDSLFGADGAKHLAVKQIDAAGNEGAVADLSFVLDRTAPDAPRWTMPVDKPALGAADVITLQGVEADALVEYRTDAAAPWLIAADGQIPTAWFQHEGPTRIEVRQTDVAGNVSPETVLSARLDLTPPVAPTLVLLNDTGASSTDGITSSGDVRVGELEPGATLLVSTNGGDWNEWAAGTTVVNVASLLPGLATVQVKQVDAAGNAGEASTLTFTLDQEALIPNWTSSSRQRQPGGAGPDQVSLNALDDFTISLHSVGARHQDSLSYRVDGGAWREPPVDGRLPLSTFGADGKHLLELRETDLAGNEGLRKVEVTLDATPPVAPTLALFHDDGPSATDHVTTDGRVVISGPDLLGLDFQSRLNGGGWVDERLGDNSPRIYSNGPGVIDLEVRFIDAAGNVGPSSALHYKVVHPGDDIPPPAVPALTFVGPTVVNQDGLRVSAAPDLKVTGLESGNATFYSLDQGRSWTAFSGDTLPATIFGVSSNGHEDQNVQVKQVDRAGNEAVSAPLHFIFDNFTPVLSWQPPSQIGPDGASAVYGPDGVPLKKPVLGREDTLTLFGIEPEARPEFSLDNGAHWSAVSGTAFGGSANMWSVAIKALFDGQADGNYALSLRQIDLVGNVSAVSSGPISVDVHAPAQPTLALRHDDGSSATDRVTSDGTFVITAQEPGSKVQYSFRGESMWHDAGTMTGQQFVLQDYNPNGLYGPMTMAVRLLDAVGNVSTSTSLSFTMVHPPL